MFMTNNIFNNLMTFQPNTCIIILFTLILINNWWEWKHKFWKWQAALSPQSLNKMLLESSQVEDHKVLLWLYMHIEIFIKIEQNQICKTYNKFSVVPNSVHAAVDKGCFYFNIEVRKAKLNSNFEVDVKHL